METRDLMLHTKERFDRGDHAVVLKTIKEVQKRGKEAVPILIEALRGGDESLLSIAAVVLGELGEEAADAIPYLAEFLQSEKEEYQILGAFTLHRIGKKSIPTLIQVAKTKEGIARFWAAWAIALIDPSQVEPYLFDILLRERDAPTSSISPLAIDEAIGKIIAYQLKEKEGEKS